MVPEPVPLPEKPAERPPVRQPSFEGLWGCLAGLAYFGMAFLQLNAIWYWFGTHSIGSLIASTVLGFIPLVGNILGWMGAVQAWHWNVWAAGAIFMWPITLIVAGGIFSGIRGR